MIYPSRRALRSIALLLLLSLILSFGGCSTELERPSDLPIPEPPTQEKTTAGDVMVGGSGYTKRVALTFDDGPQHGNNEETKSIVDELEKYGYHATFFVVGNRVPGGDSVAYAVEHGNEIGIHGYTHKVYYDSCSEDDFRYELNMTEQEIRKQIPGYKINLMRPIGGKITADRVQTCPYSVIMWSVDSNDWNHRYYPGISDEDADACVNTIVENVMSSVSDGDIILMHDIYQSTYDATKLILAQLHEQGYEVVTVSELLGDSLQKGRIYYSANT